MLRATAMRSLWPKQPRIVPEAGPFAIRMQSSFPSNLSSQRSDTSQPGRPFSQFFKTLAAHPGALRQRGSGYSGLRCDDRMNLVCTKMAGRVLRRDGATPVGTHFRRGTGRLEKSNHPNPTSNEPLTQSRFEVQSSILALKEPVLVLKGRAFQAVPVNGRPRID
jgi:hypothetical protein